MSDSVSVRPSVTKACRQWVGARVSEQTDLRKVTDDINGNGTGGGVPESGRPRTGWRYSGQGIRWHLH